MSHTTIVVLFVTLAGMVYFVEEVKPSIKFNVNEVRGALNAN